MSDVEELLGLIHLSQSATAASARALLLALPELVPTLPPRGRDSPKGPY